MLEMKHREYLRSRGYTDEMIDRESVYSSQLDPFKGWIAWKCLSMSGATAGVQLRNPDTRDYRWIQNEKAPHLPIVYATEEDYALTWETGEVILVEGIFDRAAMRRMLPEKATLARLSKGAAAQLMVLIQRYVKRVWVAFDNDEPGNQAAEKTILALSRVGVEVNKISFPAKDPAELLERVGEGKGRIMIQEQMERLVVT